MERLGRELSFALRVLLRRPGLTAAALLSMTLGIGANSAIFRVFNAAFLRPLAVTAPAAVVSVFATGSSASI